MVWTWNFMTFPNFNYSLFCWKKNQKIIKFSGGNIFLYRGYCQKIGVLIGRNSFSYRIKYLHAYRDFCNVKFVHFSLWNQYYQFTCSKELFSEAVPHSFSSKVCPSNMQQIYKMKPIRKCGFKKNCVAHLHGWSTVNLLGICRTPF